VFPGSIELFGSNSLLKMGSVENEIAVALPIAELKELALGAPLLPPLSRRGYG
jgi:hypothetical protein